LIADLWTAVEHQEYQELAQFYHPGVTYHGSHAAELRGFLQLWELLLELNAACPDLHARLDACLVDGDLVVSRVLLTWAVKDPADEPGSLRLTRTQSIVSTVRVLEGRIVEEWAAFGPLDLLRQQRKIAA
jgi:predicted ester cyclase